MTIIWAPEKDDNLQQTNANVCDCCLKKAKQQTQIADKIRMAIRRHMGVTSCLQSFNHVFAPLILLFTFQMFAMCGFIIYCSFIARFSMTERIIYLLNASVFLVKASIGFYYFGSVAGKALQVKGNSTLTTFGF